MATLDNRLIIRGRTETGKLSCGRLWCAAAVFFLATSFGLAAQVIEAKPIISAEIKKQKLVVGCELSYPPFSLTKPDQSPDGFTVDLWEAVATEAGLDYEFKVAPFHEILSGFKAGDIDVMINLAVSEVRKEFTLFAVPHVTMHGGIFVRQGSNIRTEADLVGKQLIVLNRDLAHDYALSRGYTNLVTVDDVESGLRTLSNGTAEAMLVGKLVGLNELQEHNIKNVNVLDHKLAFYQQFAFALKKDEPGSPELLAMINEGLAIVKAKGTYDTLYEKWFGVLEPRSRYWVYILKVAIPSLILICLLSAAYAFERRLRLRLKQSLATLNATLESTADGILVTSSRGQILNYNQNFLRIWNLPEQLMREGDPQKIYQHIASQTEAPAEFKRNENCLHQQSEKDLFDLIHLKDGRSLERYSKHQYVDGRSHGRVCCFRDVTAREMAAKQAAMFHQELERRVCERTLQLEAAGRELRRLSYVASKTSNMVIICSPEGLIEWCNSAFEKRTGWALPEITGRKPGDLLRGPETDLESSEKMRAAIAERKQIRVEILNYSKNGERYWAEADISPVWDDDGKLINFVSIQTDVTDRHVASIKAARQREELTELNLSLQKAMRSRDEFLAAMSHELRTPLNNILTFTEILAGQDAGALSEKQLSYLKYVTASGNHLLSLINDILDWVKIDTEDTTLEAEWCELDELIEASLRIVRSSAQKKEQLLELTPKVSELKIWADPNRLKQMLVNLLGNAIKFTPPGGKVSLRVWEHDGSAYFEIRDNGIGIEAERIADLFKPFVQLDSGLSRKFGGTGLGLALVRGIVQQLGGRITVVSEIGKGSTFSICLPIDFRKNTPEKIAS
jgi:PAS domain S-box-containing protein